MWLYSISSSNHFIHYAVMLDDTNMYAHDRASRKKAFTTISAFRSNAALVEKAIEMSGSETAAWYTTEDENLVPVSIETANAVATLMNNLCANLIAQKIENCSYSTQLVRTIKYNGVQILFWVMFEHLWKLWSEDIKNAEGVFWLLTGDLEKIQELWIIPESVPFLNIEEFVSLPQRSFSPIDEMIMDTCMRDALPQTLELFQNPWTNELCKTGVDLKSSGNWADLPQNGGWYRLLFEPEQQQRVTLEPDDYLDENGSTRDVVISIRPLGELAMSPDDVDIFNNQQFPDDQQSNDDLQNTYYRFQNVWRIIDKKADQVNEVYIKESYYNSIRFASQVQQFDLFNSPSEPSFTVPLTEKSVVPIVISMPSFTKVMNNNTIFPSILAWVMACDKPAFSLETGGIRPLDVLTDYLRRACLANTSILMARRPEEQYTFVANVVATLLYATIQRNVSFIEAQVLEIKVKNQKPERRRQNFMRPEPKKMTMDEEGTVQPAQLLTQVRLDTLWKLAQDQNPYWKKFLENKAYPVVPGGYVLNLRSFLEQKGYNMWNELEQSVHRQGPPRPPAPRPPPAGPPTQRLSETTQQNSATIPLVTRPRVPQQFVSSTQRFDFVLDQNVVTVITLTREQAQRLLDDKEQMKSLFQKQFSTGSTPTEQQVKGWVQEVYGPVIKKAFQGTAVERTGSMDQYVEENVRCIERVVAPSRS